MIVLKLFPLLFQQQRALNIVLHRHFLGTDRLEKRMWMERNTEWQVGDMVFVPKALTNLNIFFQSRTVIVLVQL